MRPVARSMPDSVTSAVPSQGWPATRARTRGSSDSDIACAERVLDELVDAHAGSEWAMETGGGRPAS